LLDFTGSPTPLLIGAHPDLVAMVEDLDEMVVVRLVLIYRLFLTR
jgi:hypothetical protein